MSEGMPSSPTPDSEDELQPASLAEIRELAREAESRSIGKNRRRTSVEEPEEEEPTPVAPPITEPVAEASPAAPETVPAAPVTPGTNSSSSPHP